MDQATPWIMDFRDEVPQATQLNDKQDSCLQVQSYGPKKIHMTELNQTMVRSIFQLWLPKFGVILVASCLISKIIQNCSKTR